MTIESEIAGCNLVLVGQFNPPIFHPTWLVREGLISSDQAEQAEITIIHPDICQFTVANINLTVEPTRVVVDTTIAPWVRIMDFVSKAFGEILIHTPVTQIGVNYQRHFRLESAQVRMALGRKLAPVAVWGAWAEKIENKESFEKQGGLISLTMRELWSEGMFRGHHQANVQPSQKIPNNTGVYIETNSHVEASDGSLNSSELVRYMASNFQSYLDKSDWITQQLFEANGVN